MSSNVKLIKVSKLEQKQYKYGIFFLNQRKQVIKSVLNSSDLYSVNGKLLLMVRLTFAKDEQFHFSQTT